MSHFAEIKNNIVIQVIVAEQDFIDTQSGTWIQTSYNTRKGVNLVSGISLRKNYAKVGDTFDVIRDAFISPKPYPSWILNEEECFWYPPIKMPFNLSGALWDESSLNWKGVDS